MTQAPDLDTRNVNALWCSVLVETLVRKGVRQAVVSPGSRSTPLAFALARHPGIEAVPVLDERSAAFFALGLSKQQGLPVALLCTSGTAAANYFPAVVEANEGGAPLIVMTADRPPEMRGCGSGQTIDQQKLYGGYVGFYHECAVPELDLGLFRYLRQTVAHAVDRSLSPSPMAVHLNLPFRDPLPPIADGGKAEAFAKPVDWTQFFAEVSPSRERGPFERVEPLRADQKGLIVAGPAHPADPAAYAAQIGEIAQFLGWPVLAEGLSPLRNFASRVPGLVTTYDALLREPKTAQSLKPDFVLCLGAWPTSKVLRAFLEAADAPIWFVSDRPDNRDALHGRTSFRCVTLQALIASLPSGTPADSAYAQSWRSHEAKASTERDRRMAAEQEIVEPKATWLLARHLPKQTPVFIANSMPVRDVEYVWPTGDREIRPLFNRGANGIDGTLSSALGAVHKSVPGILLTGDLALLHDSNGFLLGGKFQGSLTIVLVNNHGGGIFEHLPVAKFDPPFEEYFATPQAVDFESLAAAHRVRHQIVASWTELIELISTLPAEGIRILELRTDRKRDAAWRKAFFAALSAAGAA